MIGRLLYRLRRPALLLASAAALTAAIVPAPQLEQAPVAQEVVAAPTPSPVEETPVPVPVFAPTEIELPTLNQTAPVVPVGVEADGAMGTPSNAVDVAWWDGVRVGEGNALLAGHKDWNKRPGTFFRLGELKRGDPVVVRGPEGELRFEVAWVHQLHRDSDAAGILGDQGAPTLTLITCGGRFDRAVRGYEDRIVARAVLRA
ncbi:MAG TPA: class F sortase [Actinomycetota bacterium]|nr:class F sortase [Actinomycetota bacterium]